jgi:hypothetical protein
MTSKRPPFTPAQVRYLDDRFKKLEAATDTANDKLNAYVEDVRILKMQDQDQHEKLQRLRLTANELKTEIDNIREYAYM